MKWIKMTLLLAAMNLTMVAIAQDDVQTRENAVKRDQEAKAAKQAEYDAHRDHLEEIQDKATRKRMKKNLKKSQRISQGKQIPWYKRVFRKRRTR
jgi:Ni/Co efflux regulator RcnB